MADRTAGIDEAHCKLVLNKLGKFHAASMALEEKVLCTSVTGYIN